MSLANIAVENIKGVGSSIAEKLSQLNIVTVQDLFEHFPYRYENFELIDIHHARHEEKITVAGKEYEAMYFGEQDLTQFNLAFVKREFWRLENAFDDFKNNALTGDNLPYGNYPMAIEAGQIFVIDYTDGDGNVTRMYYRSDGTVWQGNPTTVEFIIE